MILKAILGCLFNVSVTGGMLFLGAGRLDWPEGWTFLTLLVLVTLGGGAMMLRRDPELMRERIQSPFQRGQATWDKVFYALFIPSFYGGLALMGADAVRYRWSEVPLWVELLGGVGVFAACVMFYWVLRENSFAAPVVKLQEKRGQRVITTGPYAYVRHPMYSSALLMFPSLALMLGSWWGLVVAGFIAILFVVRTALEDRLLRRELDGYADYATRVRFRLIPGVW